MFKSPIDSPVVSPFAGPWGHGQSGVPGDPIFLALGRDGFEDSIGLSTRPVKKKQHIAMDGTGTLNNANLTATCAITQPNGTSVLTAGSGEITGTAGTVWTFSVLYDDGAISLYEYAALVGAATAVVFDISGNGRHLVMTGFADVPAACAESVTTGSDWLNRQGYNDCLVGLVPYAVTPEPVTWTAPTPNLYVSKSGLDANNGLTPETAKLTIGAAITAASAGQCILVGAGAYTENKSATFGVEITTTKPLYIYGVGEVSINSSATYMMGWNATSGTTTFHNINFTVSDTVGHRFNGAGRVRLIDCHNNLPVPTTKGLMALADNSVLEIIGGGITAVSSTQSFISGTGAGALLISGFAFAAGKADRNLIFLSGASTKVHISGSVFSVTDLSETIGTQGIINITNNTGPVSILANTFTINDDVVSEFAAVRVTATTVGAKGSVNVDDNDITTAGTTGYGIIIGGDATGNGNGTIPTPRVANNRITVTAPSNTAHGILIGYQANTTTFGNKVSGAFYGEVRKGNGTDQSAGVLFGSVFVQCKFDVYAKGAAGLRVYNIHSESSVAGGCVLYVDANDSYSPINTELKNCTYSLTGTKKLIIDATGNIPGANVDNNIGTCENTILTTIGATSRTFAEHQTAGYDASGLAVNPELLANHSILATSPCCQSGASLTLPAGMITDYLRRVVASTGTLNVGPSAGLPLTPNGSTTPTDALGGYISADRLGRVKYSFSDGKWPSASELIAVTGVDNAVFDANGDGVDFGEDTAAALAALATVEDNIKLFVGAKGAVLYDTDQSANLAKIQRAGY